MILPRASTVHTLKSGPGCHSQRHAPRQWKIRRHVTNLCHLSLAKYEHSAIPRMCNCVYAFAMRRTRKAYLHAWVTNIMHAFIMHLHFLTHQTYAAWECVLLTAGWHLCCNQNTVEYCNFLYFVLFLHFIYMLIVRIIFGINVCTYSKFSTLEAGQVHLLLLYTTMPLNYYYTNKLKSKKHDKRDPLNFWCSVQCLSLCLFVRHRQPYKNSWSIKFQLG